MCKQWMEFLFGWSFAVVLFQATTLQGGELSRPDAIRLEPIGTCRLGNSPDARGTSEVIAYHSATHSLYAVNSENDVITRVSISDPARPEPLCNIDLSSFGSQLTSVAARGDVLAACLVGKSPAARGSVVFFRPDGEVIGAIQVGWHPDMVMFTPDQSRLIVANEGEPSADGAFDGEGSVSIVDVPSPLPRDLAGVRVRDAGFRAWDHKPLPEGVRAVNTSIPFSQDAEPEGIAIAPDSTAAYVSLQENNAIAVVDIEAARVTQLIGLGFKDHSAAGNELDLSMRGSKNHLACAPIFGMYQPDNVGYFRAGRASYLVLANEGDARKNDAYHEVVQLKHAVLDSARFPHAEQLQSETHGGNLMVSRTGDIDGDGDLDELLTFGGRSLSIVSVADGKRVYDSGSEIERLVAERITKERQHDPNSQSAYAAKNGPEPEALAIGTLGGRTYGFLGLERDSGIVTFDITNPARAKIVGYVHPRQFTDHAVDIGQDVAPEGLVFIASEVSPLGIPLLAVANEVSGTVTVYAITRTAFTSASR